MHHLFLKIFKSLVLTFCIHQLAYQEIFAQNLLEKTQKELVFQLLDSLNMRPIPYMQFLIVEFNPTGDSLKKIGITNETGIFRITYNYPTKIHFNSKFYLKISISLKDLKPSIINNIVLCPSQNELEEVMVRDRKIFSINKVEFRVKSPHKSQAPILKNFLKSINGISFQSNNYKYLGKTITFYLDGVKVESEFIKESAIESFEKLEIISAPNGEYWMKASEVIFNLISKRPKNPTVGIQTNTEFAMLFPYLSQNLGIYSLGRKSSFRASSLFYSYSQNEQSNLTQELNQIKSLSYQQLKSTTTPNFNTFIFNYNLDSLTTISLNIGNQYIRNSQNSDFTFSPLTSESLVQLNSKSKRNYDKWSNNNLLLFKHRNHKLFVRYDFGNTNIKNKYQDIIELNQLNYEKSNSTHINYANSKQLSKLIKLNTTLSWENKNSTVQYNNQKDDPITSYFISNFIGLKSILNASYENLFILLGGRIDLINQDFESSTTKFHRANQLLFLPTLSLQYDSEKIGNYNFSLNYDYTLPDISQLATFSRRLDPFKTVIGNNILDIESSINLSLTHMIKVKQLDLSTELEYNEMNNYLGYSPYKLEGNQLIQSYTNLGKIKYLTFQVNSSVQLNKSISSQLSLAQKFVKFNLNSNWNYSNFNPTWVPVFSISNSWEYQFSPKFSAALNLYFNNFEYEFFITKNYIIPNTSFSINGTLGRDWYVTLNWNTIFSNANQEKTTKSQQIYSSITNYTNNYRYVSLSIQKSFGKKINNVPVSSTADEVRRKFKTL